MEIFNFLCVSELNFNISWRNYSDEQKKVQTRDISIRKSIYLVYHDQ